MAHCSMPPRNDDTWDEPGSELFGEMLKPAPPARAANSRAKQLRDHGTSRAPSRDRASRTSPMVRTDVTPSVTPAKVAPGQGG